MPVILRWLAGTPARLRAVSPEHETPHPATGTGLLSGINGIEPVEFVPTRVKPLPAIDWATLATPHDRLSDVDLRRLGTQSLPVAQHETGTLPPSHRWPAQP